MPTKRLPKSNKTFKDVSDDMLQQMIVFLTIENFWNFCQYMDPAFFNDNRPYLKEIAEQLERVYNKELNKIVISLPPRVGKSYMLDMFCLWLIGKGATDPDTSIMRNSYGADIAEKFSYDIRELMKSEKYLSIFPNVKLKRGAINDWAIEGAAQSTYICSGVGGSITGKGCKTLAILDDPIKNFEDANSPTILEKTWNWYTSTHRARMEKGCAEIIIATRWSKRDPIGQVLKRNKKGWHVISVPALTDDEKSFCEDIMPTEEFLEKKRFTDPAIWEAEYQQNPIELKGLLFPEESLLKFSIKELDKYFDPKCYETFDAVINYTDTADEGLDYLASVTVGIIGPKWFLLDVVFTQDAIEHTQPRVAKQIMDYGVNKARVESNAGGKSYALKLKEILESFKCFTNVDWKPNRVNKETRILIVSGEIKQCMYFRNDYIPGSDYDKFMQKLTSYARMGKNESDDAPDALTGIVEMIGRPSLRFLQTKH